MLLPLHGGRAVTPISQALVRNRLLGAMAPDDFALIEARLETVPLTLRAQLIEPGARIDHVTFVERGTVSLIADTEGRHFEVGMIGFEGLVGIPVILGVAASPYIGMVQAPGSALRIGSADLNAACRRSETLRGLLLRYVHTFLVQVSQTAYANAGYSLAARLARWILLTADRLDHDDLPLTHDLLAIMLGAHRPGVTNAVQQLEGDGLIKATRGRIVIRDRPGLEGLAGHAYGLAEREYAALFPPPLKPQE